MSDDKPFRENRGTLRHRRVDELFRAADRLADLPLPPLTAKEVESEIAAARRQRRSGSGSQKHLDLGPDQAFLLGR